MRSKPGPWKFLLLFSILPLPLGAAEGTVLYRLEKGSTLQKGFGGSLLSLSKGRSSYCLC